MLFRYLFIVLMFLGNSIAQELWVGGILITSDPARIQGITLQRLDNFRFIVVSNKTRKFVDRVVVSVGLDGLGAIFAGDKREISLKLAGVKLVDALSVMKKKIGKKGVFLISVDESIFYSFDVNFPHLPVTSERFYFDSKNPVSISELLKLTPLNPEKVNASIRQIDLDGDFKLREVKEFDSVFLKPGNFSVTFSDKKPSP